MGLYPEMNNKYYFYKCHENLINPTLIKGSFTQKSDFALSLQVYK
jgi:hypothetical protein